MKNKLVFVTGGARSGKSTYAETLMREAPGTTAYIATAVPFDEGMRDRIRHHRAQRPSEWETIEQYERFEELPQNAFFAAAQNILFDCVTVMITNQLMDMNLDWDSVTRARIDEAEAYVRAQTQSLVEALRTKNSVIVSNELGMGLVPANRLSSCFRDIAGRMNQYIAEQADEVYITISGIPVRIK